jgi:hypothetical protein
MNTPSMSVTEIYDLKIWEGDNLQQMIQLGPFYVQQTHL